MPYPFTGPKMFRVGTKTNFTECKSSFCLAQYVNKCLVRHKEFGLAQNILRPVKGQGINHLIESVVN